MPQVPTTAAPKSEAQERVKALLKSKKKTKNWKLHYALWIGGSLGSVVVAVVMLLVNPERGPFQILVNDPGLIDASNRNSKSWNAGPVSFFEGWTIGEFKLLQGVGVSKTGLAATKCQAPDMALPSSFNARDKWPECFNNPVYSMGNCSASWAIATASALSNRFCIANTTKYGDLVLSPQQLLSCDAQNRGCGGGDLDTAFQFARYEGLVTEKCFPYLADSRVDCHMRCRTEKPHFSGSLCIADNAEAIRAEIFHYGPVVAPMFLMDDFLVYKSGVYQELATSTQLTDARRSRIVHAVKILGWGKVGKKDYWMIENSWGEDWGEEGFAKVLAGSGDAGKEAIIVEGYAVAGSPKLVDDMDDQEDDIPGNDEETLSEAEERTESNN